MLMWAPIGHLPGPTAMARADQSSPGRLSLSSEGVPIRMQDLRQSTCVPCRGGVAPLTRPEIEALLPQAPGWQVVEGEGVLRLERTFTFRDFRSAMNFATRVGELAEREQ